MKEIGGYIELDQQFGSIYHDKALALNCGRASLEYLILARNIKAINLPYFCCDAVAMPCRKHGVQVKYYGIGSDFRPKIDNIVMDEDEYLYLVNYYGQLSNEQLLEYVRTYRNVIVDNAQAYFQAPLDGVDTIYTCRKYFGVSDGAFLYTSAKCNIEIEKDESFERIRYVLGRYERSAGEFYYEATENNMSFNSEPIKYMSRLTENMLRAIDYKFVREVREQNFGYLHDKLTQYNKLNVSLPIGAFMYPLYIDNGQRIRESLQKKKIFVPTLWPDVFNLCEKDSREFDLAENILPLPIDQRYSIGDMEYIIDELLKELKR